MIVKVSKITSKGQLTLPADIRRDLGINIGDSVVFDKRNGDVILRKVQNESIVEILDQAPPLSKKATKAVKNLRDEWD